MKVSYEWLYSFLPELKASPEEVAHLFTMHSFETVVGTERKIDSNIVVVKITAIEPHPNADRLRLVSVTDGTQTIKVVCGAANITVGDVVPYSPPGSTVQDDKGQAQVVKETVIRGQKSPGMLNSPRELGLSDVHGGLLLLPSATPLGTPLKNHLPSDTILEADISPNRGHDCLSHRGLARELAALLNLEVKEPVTKIPDKKPLSSWQVTIEDPLKAPRFAGALFQIDEIHPSPLWLQSRLFTVGARPLNNIVDITNYVMFELGNPTHAYDADKLPGDKLPGKKMGVRWVRAGEVVVTLDGVKRELTEDTLVITSNDQPVAIAGIMGGEATQISESTKHVFLEVANFNAFAIQQAATRLALRTEGSARWSKGVDPELAGDVFDRSISLLRDIAGADLQGTLDVYPRPRQAKTIIFPVAKIAALTGDTVPTADAILHKFRFSVREKTADIWEVTPPTDRLDIMGVADVVEEIIRFQGLNNLPAVLPRAPLVTRAIPEAIEWRETIRDVLVSSGLIETYNYIFEEGDLAKLLRLDTIAHLDLINPIAPNRRRLRISLLPGLLQNLQHNQAEFPSLGLFEVGLTMYPTDNVTTPTPGVREEQQLAIAISGQAEAFRLAKGIVETVAARLGLANLNYNQTQPSPQRSWLSMWQPGQVAEIKYGEAEIGTIGMLSSRVSQQLKLKDVVLAEIKLDALIAQASAERLYQPLAKFPPVLRDVSLKVPEDVAIERVQGIIERAGGPLLADIDLFDMYDASTDTAAVSADPVASKNLAFHLRFQAPDRTLTDAEVDRLQKAIETALETELGAQIR